MKSDFAFPQPWRGLHRNYRRQYSPDTVLPLQAPGVRRRGVRLEQYSTAVSGTVLCKPCRFLLEYHPENQTADPVHLDRRDLK